MRSSREHRAVAECVNQITSLLQQLRKSEGSYHPEFKRHAEMRLATMARDLTELTQVTLSFHATESWRTVYERVLSQCKTRRYLSVALLRTDNYWRDLPGQASLEFNFKLIEHGFSVQRTFIIDPFFWPPSAKTPSAGLLRWIMSQQHKDVTSRLVRLAELDEESDLVGDFGIYGSDAVGKQTVDFEGKTQSYEISFDADRMREAEERWERLLLYSVLVDDLLNGES